MTFVGGHETEIDIYRVFLGMTMTEEMGRHLLETPGQVFVCFVGIFLFFVFSF